MEIRLSIYLVEELKNEMIKSEVPLLMTIITKDLSAKPFIREVTFINMPQSRALLLEHDQHTEQCVLNRKNKYTLE